MQPKVSIIIPVFNTQKYIRRCLESCIHQTLKEIEIIIINDCGQDDAISIAHDYANKDSRITILHHAKNSGTFQARNTGIQHANGEYCMFCDSDDFLDIRACEIAYNAICEQKTDILALGMQHFPKTLKRTNHQIHKDKSSEDAMRQIIAGSPDAQSLCDKIIRREIIKTASETLSFIQKPLMFFEDGLLLLVASFYAKDYFGQKDVIYYYCANDASSITRQTNTQNLHTKYTHLEYILEISEKLKKIFPQYIHFIQKFNHKTASMLIVQARLFGPKEFKQGYEILKKYDFTKKPWLGGVYLKSVCLSLCYHFRWQNLIRLIAYLVSLGKIKF